FSTRSSVFAPAAVAIASDMSGSHIGGHDGFVVRHFFVRTFGQYFALVEHGNGVGELGDDAEVVVDHEYGALGSDLPNQYSYAADILGAHALGGFVEQQQFRVEGQCRGDFQRPLAAIGQFDTGRVGEVGQADVVEQGHGPLVQRVEDLVRAPEVIRQAE